MSDDLGHVIDLCDRGAFAEASAFVRGLGSEPFPLLLDALIHMRQADAGTARELIDRAMSLSTSPDADSLILAAMISRELGDTTQAISFGLRATRLSPHDWRAHVALARAMAAGDSTRGQEHEAERAARRAVGLAPDEAFAHLALGEALLAQVSFRGRVREEAVAALKRAAELAPGNAEIQKALAKALPSDDSTPWLGCLALIALIAFFGAGHRLIEMAGNGIAGLLGIERNGADDTPSIPGILILIAICAVAWVVVRVIRIRRRGDRPSVAIGRRRALSRDLHFADEESLHIASAAVAAVVCVVPFFVTGFLIASGPDDAPTPILSLLGVVALPVLGWSAVRWWFGPGQVRRALRASRLLTVCLLVSYILMIGTVLLSWAEVSDGGVWNALMVVHLAWFAAGLVPVIINGRLRRRRARSGQISPPT